MKGSDHPYVRMGLTLFLSLAATTILVFLLIHIETLWHGARLVLSALSPIVTGFALSYILRPAARGLERNCLKIKGIRKLARPISVLLTVLLALCAVTLFVVMVVPQLGSSVKGLVESLPGLVEQAIVRVESFLRRDDEWSARFLQAVNAAETFIIEWAQGNLLNSIGTIATNIMVVGTFLVNLVMSVIVAVYLLMGWERYLSQIKKLFLAVSRNKRFNRIVFTAMKKTNHIFSGFINGKLLDSLIVGIICFISLSIMQMPYALLISVIVGVTNIIPVFGPFIGAVPSAFLVLLISPPKCLAFLIFIVILQQIDGNILGPRILGDSTGLSALYVMTSMLLFGKLLGFLGMVIGVPLFATLYYIVKELAEYSLRKQHLPLDTTEYAVPGMPSKKEE